jgi:phenylacetate-CoA ligase
MGMLGIVGTVYGLRKRQSFTRAQMSAYQTRMLRDMVRHAWHRSPFYREYYTDHGLKEADLGDIGVGDLPLTDKELLMEHFDRVVTDRRVRKADLERFILTPVERQMKYLGRYTVVHTSGSSGNVGIFVHDSANWIISRFGPVVRGDRPGLRRERVASCLAIEGRYVGVTMARSAPKLLATALVLSVQDPINRTVEALNIFQPTILTGYSSTIAALARQTVAGRLKIAPHQVWTSGEMLTDEMQRDIEEAWPGRQGGIYASTEFLYIAVQYPGHRAYTVFDDLNILELLDDQQQPVAQGQTGKIVLTSLYNRILPMIRYQMMDMAQRSVDRPEGPFSTLAGLRGRVNDALPIVLDNGQPGTLSPIVLCGFAASGLKKAKFVLTAADRIEIRYTSEQNIDAVIKERFHKVLAASGAAQAMHVGVKRVRELPLDPRTGKFRITEIHCPGGNPGTS